MNPSTAACGLGWLSIGLGAAEIVAPRRLGRSLGIEDRAGLLRAFGARELVAGVGLLARSSDPAPWLWARAAGDALDLATLGRAVSRGRRPLTAAVATAVVVGVTALDVACALRAAEGRTGKRIDLSSTTVIDRPAAELHRLFQQPETIGRLLPGGVATATADGHVHCTYRTLSGKRYGWDSVFVESRPGESATWGPAPASAIRSGGSVAFAPVPGGTEVTLRLWVEPPSALRDPLALLLPRVVNDAMLAQALRRFAATATGNVP